MGIPCWHCVSSLLGFCHQSRVFGSGGGSRWPLALIALSIMLLNAQQPFPGWQAALPCIGALLVIWSGSSEPALTRILASRPVVFLGKISFSLYLWHWPAIVFAHALWGTGLSATQDISVLAISFGLALLSWRFIEEPPRRRRTIFTRRRLFTGTALLIVLLGSQRIIANSDHGFPGRFGPAATGFLRDDSWRPPPGCSDLVTSTCIVGAPDAVTSFAVIGDSVGHSALPGLIEEAERHGRSGVFFSKAGCLPLVDAQLTDAGCTAFMRRAFFEVAKSPSIRVVVLIGSVAHRSRGTAFRTSRTAVDSGSATASVAAGIPWRPIALFWSARSRGRPLRLELDGL